MITKNILKFPSPTLKSNEPSPREFISDWRDIPENHHQLESHKVFIAKPRMQSFGIKVHSFITTLLPKDCLKIPAGSF